MLVKGAAVGGRGGPHHGREVGPKVGRAAQSAPDGDVIGRQHVESIELSTREDDRGMLDPLRIAPADLRVELTHSFLTELLPAPVPPEWQTEIRAAVALWPPNVVSK